MKSRGLLIGVLAGLGVLVGIIHALPYILFPIEMGKDYAFSMPNIMPASPRSVLDLGGGSGSNRNYFCDRGDEYLILEVDPDVRFVRENLGKNAYVIGDAHSTVLAPAHASWLDQAEILLSILSRKYLKRGSWDGRRALSYHLRRAVTEYNRLSAHPFDWSFTRQAMRNWHEKYCGKN